MRAELGASAHVADLTDPAQVRRLADEAGPVDVLVCNAGMAQTGAAVVERSFLELDRASMGERAGAHALDRVPDRAGLRARHGPAATGGS